MKKFIYLLPFLLLSFSAFSQDPCEGMEDEFVCVELTPGFVVPMSACEAMLANLSVVDCDDYGIVFENDTSDVVINDWDEECDCNWDSEEFVCVFLFGDVLEVHACDVQCGSFGDLGEFGEFEIVDCEDLVYGCNDSNALNYNEDATVNDGSCEYEDWGTDCDCDWNSEEYICLAFDDEIMTVHVCDLECNSWGEDFLGFDFEVVDCEDLVYGCNDSNALNYNEDATVNDGSCEYEDLGEECDCNWDSEEFVCVSLFGDVLEVHACDVQCGSFGDLGEFGEFEIVDCEDLVYGCTDSNALNYNEDATVNDGSCEYEDWGTECDCDWDSEEYICLSFDGQIMTVHVCELECDLWEDGLFGFDFEVVDCEELVYGCNDSNALNYNEDATVNDGSCEYEDWGTECDCDWDSEEYACLSIDGEIMEVHVCELECDLWGNGFFGFDFEVVDCEDLVYGCNDSNALNYNEDATVNDGSCEYEDLGEECDCDWDSEEYVCLSFDGEIMVVHVCELECNLWGDDFLGFDFEVVDCEGEDDGEDIEDEIENILEDFYGGGQFNQENFQNLADLLIELFVFPNPLEDGDGLGVFIDSNMESSATVQIVNNLGQTVYSSRENLLKGKNVLEIDVNELESGFYFTLVNADNGISATQKFIKN